MYEFLDRLISLALPRVRDFRGLNPKAFDGHGNYSLGLTEQLVFPELNPDKFTARAGHEHHDLLLGGQRTTNRASCCGRSACRSRREDDGKRKKLKTAELRDAEDPAYAVG